MGNQGGFPGGGRRMPPTEEEKKRQRERRLEDGKTLINYFGLVDLNFTIFIIFI